MHNPKLPNIQTVLLPTVHPIDYYLNEETPPKANKQTPGPGNPRITIIIMMMIMLKAITINQTQIIHQSPILKGQTRKEERKTKVTPEITTQKTTRTKSPPVRGGQKENTVKEHQ